MQITINGSIVSARTGTLSIEDNINARSTAKFVVNTDMTIEAGQEVIITDNSVKIFGGSIDNFNKRFLLGGTEPSRKEYSINCVDYNQIADRRKVAASYVDQTINYILNDLITNQLADEGITLGTVTNGDTVLKQVVFNYVSFADALQFIQNATGLNWNIDFDKVLTLFLNEDNITDGFSTDLQNFYNAEINETRQNYRNTQYIRAGDGTTEVQVKEPVSPKPDGVSRTFGGRFPIATKPLIYVDDVQVDPADIGINGLDLGKKWYWQKNSKDITQDPAETVLSDTQTLTKSYQGLKPIIVRVDNPTAINTRSAIEGGTGIYEEIEDQKQIDNRQAALDYGQGVLTRFSVIPSNIFIYTDEYRKAGKICKITIPELDIDGNYLITNVSINDIDCGIMRYKITLASGQDFGSWVEFFRRFKPQDFSIRENEIVVLLQTQEETENYVSTYKIRTFNFPKVNIGLKVGTFKVGGTAITEVIVND